jgi:hypothetical protein
MTGSEAMQAAEVAYQQARDKALRDFEDATLPQRTVRDAAVMAAIEARRVALLAAEQL